MTEHKYTDEEIIKALKYHSAPSKPCVQKFVYGDQRFCGSEMAKDALILITRQKAEIAFWMDAAANAKKEAVKEFAEKLKKECLFDRGYEILQDGTIDHLVKEFTEEKT